MISLRCTRFSSRFRDRSRLTCSKRCCGYPRHEYFRRILCNLIGRDVAKGELPHDMELLGAMVRDICFHNAHRYFDLEVSPD